MDPVEWRVAAERGHIVQDQGPERDLQAVLFGQKPATDFEIHGHHPLSEMYETGELEERVRIAGTVMRDDHYGGVIIGRDDAAVERLETAKHGGRPTIARYDFTRGWSLRRRRRRAPAPTAWGYRFFPVGGGALFGRALAAGQIEGGVDQRYMRKRLRKIPDLALRARIVFLRQQAEIVAQPEQSFEKSRASAVRPCRI